MIKESINCLIGVVRVIGYIFKGVTSLEIEGENDERRLENILF